MAKTVIFNNQVYELDENKLAPINASIVEFLTTELAGTGTTIKFNNTTYEVDGAKLSTSKSALVNFLGTIEGEGEIIEIDGVEYSVASSALEEANVTVAETLVNLSVTHSEGLEYELNEGGASYSVIGIGTCTDTDVVIPAEYEGLPVTSIGPSAFENCSSLTSVIIPDSVTSIGDSAFQGCDSLTDIYINKDTDSVSGSPWGADDATVHWNSEEITQLVAPVMTVEGDSLIIDNIDENAETISIYVDGVEQYTIDIAADETSNFVLADGTYYETSDNLIFNVASIEDDIDELQGTWVFNDNEFSFEDSPTYNVNFTCDGTTYSTIRFAYQGMGSNMYYDDTQVTYDASEHGYGVWVDEKYKTINITSTVAEVENGSDLLALLKYQATKIITFTIDDSTFSAEDGATWGEWVASNYNTNGFVESDGSIVSTIGNPLVYSNTYVNSDDVIIYNAHYTTDELETSHGSGTND